MTMHKKLGRFHIQLFGNVFADFDQVFAAVTASAGFRFVAVFDAWEMRRQGLATGTRTFRFGDGLARLVVLELLDFRFDGRQIGIPGFLEDITLQRRQAFAFDAETNALVIGQLKGQGFDFEVFGPDGLRIAIGLIQ